MSDNPLFRSRVLYCGWLGCERLADWASTEDSIHDLYLCEFHGGTKLDAPGWVKVNHA